MLHLQSALQQQSAGKSAQRAHQLVQKTEGPVHQGCIYTERGALRSAFPEPPAHRAGGMCHSASLRLDHHLTSARNTVWLCSHDEEFLMDRHRVRETREQGAT
jgi:hypothetical protein